MSHLNPEDILLYLISRSGRSREKLSGRKKLMKLAFFAEHYLPGEDKLSGESILNNYEFFIFKYGPFSKDVMHAFDELKKDGLVAENDEYMKHIISTTDESENTVQSIGSELPEDIRRHLDVICIEFGEYTGAQLEKKALDYLGINRQEKRRLQGMSIEAVVARKAN